MRRPSKLSSWLSNGDSPVARKLACPYLGSQSLMQLSGAGLGDPVLRPRVGAGEAQVQSRARAVAIVGPRADFAVTADGTLGQAGGQSQRWLP